MLLGERSAVNSRSQLVNTPRNCCTIEIHNKTMNSLCFFIANSGTRASAAVFQIHMDPHHFGKLDQDPHKSGKLDPGPHQSEKQDPDLYQSENV